MPSAGALSSSSATRGISWIISGGSEPFRHEIWRTHAVVECALPDWRCRLTLKRSPQLRGVPRRPRSHTTAAYRSTSSADLDPRHARADDRVPSRGSWRSCIVHRWQRSGDWMSPGRDDEVPPLLAEEIRELAERLNVVDRLNAYGQALQYAEREMGDNAPRAHLPAQAEHRRERAGLSVASITRSSQRRCIAPSSGRHKQRAGSPICRKSVALKRIAHSRPAAGPATYRRRRSASGRSTRAERRGAVVPARCTGIDFNRVHWESRSNNRRSSKCASGGGNTIWPNDPLLGGRRSLGWR